jgi:hypothetical protein
LGNEHVTENGAESEVPVATAEECRRALERLTGRISEMDPADRANWLADRAISCHVSDLGVTFKTELSPDGATPVEQVNGSAAPAQVRFTTTSGELLKLAEDPGGFPRAWLSGRLKIEASFRDLLRLRKIL